MINLTLELSNVEKAELILRGHCNECFASPVGWEHFEHCSKFLITFKVKRIKSTEYISIYTVLTKS